MIRFTCPYCGTQLSAPKECAGRSSKCRQCGQPVTVPQPVPVAAQIHPTKLPPPTLEKPVSVAQPVETKRRNLLVAGIAVGVCAALVLVVSIVFWVTGAKRSVVPVTVIDDERNIPASKENRIDLFDVDETASLIKSRIVDLKRHKSNPIRLADKIASANKEMAKYVGKDVRWTFTVSQILPGSPAPNYSPGAVHVHNLWKTTDGSRWPSYAGNSSGKLIVKPVFIVRFLDPGQTEVKRTFPGEGGIMNNVHGGSLIIDTEIPKAVAAALNVGDRVVVTGTVAYLQFTQGPFCNCVLRDVRAKKK